MEHEIMDLWRIYKEHQTSESREQLILHYSPLVKFVAGRVASNLPPNVEQADLVSYGIFGLIDAIDKFDLSRGFKFETYAIPRIKGAIIDELRSMDWVPRSVRAKARLIEQTYSKLESQLKRTPKNKEIAQELNIGEEEFAHMLSQVALVGLTALDDLLSSSGGERAGAATIGDTVFDRSQIPVESFEIDEIRSILANAIDTMPDRERLVITLYYYEGFTLAQIGSVLGVTESRVCQIHTKAILKLSGRLSYQRGVTG